MISLQMVLAAAALTALVSWTSLSIYVLAIQRRRGPLQGATHGDLVVRSDQQRSADRPGRMETEA